MESRPTSSYSATALSSAYAAGVDLPSPWVRPALAFYNNTQLGQYEVYSSGTLHGVVKYSVHGRELWLLSAETPNTAGPRLLQALLRDVLDEALKRHIAVMPFSTDARQFIRDHRVYWSLVPETERKRFKLPSPTNRDQEMVTGRSRVPLRD